MSSRLMFLLLAATVGVGCSTLDLDRRYASMAVWATEGGTTQRQNAVPQRLEPPLEQRWDFNAGAGFGNVSPLIVGDVIFVATLKGDIHAIDMASGDRLGQASFGESIQGTPLYADETLIVPLAWGGVALHAHNLIEGSRRWRVKNVPISAGLTRYEDRVIAGDVEGTVRAYDIRRGSELWSRTLAERSGIYSTPVVVGDRLVVANDRGTLTALDPRDGSLMWTAETGAPVQVSLAARESTVIASTTRGRLTAFRVETGERLWDFAIPNEAVYFTAPAVGEWEVVVGGSDGLVRSIDLADGTLNWEVTVPGAVTATPVITDHMIYIGTMTSRLLALAREDGSATWDTELEGRVKSAFAVTGDRLVVLAEPRLVYLFEPSTENYATHDE